MSFFSEYGKEIVSLIVPFIAWILNVGIKARPKIVKAVRHQFVFLVQEPILDANGAVVSPNQRVCTATYQVMNFGREVANKIEIVFNWKPQCLNVWPVRSFEEKTDPDGRTIIIFDNLAPREEIGISVMSVNKDLPALISVRSAECLAQEVELSWYVRVPPWRMRIAQVLLLLGIFVSIYLLISLIQFLVLKTPPL